MKSRILLIVLAVTLVISSIALGACQPGPKEAIVLRHVSFLPDRPPGNIPMVQLCDMVREKSNGELIIERIGGPEVMAAVDAPGAVQKGVVEMGNVLWSLTDMLVPGIRTLSHMEISYVEAREKGGAYDYVQELCNKAGLYFLGNTKATEPQTFLYNFTSKRVTKPEDFQGQKLGTPSPLAVPFYEAMGATGVVMPFADYYTAMERGVIDGFNYSPEDMVATGLPEVTKFIVDHPYTTSPDGWVINLDVWNGLPKKLQDVLIESIIEHEAKFADYYKEEILKPAKEAMSAEGMEIITFSPADAERYYKLYKDSCWAEEIKKHPDVAPKMKELLTKK